VCYRNRLAIRFVADVVREGTPPCTAVNALCEKKKDFLKMFLLLPRAPLLHCRERAVCTILLLFIMLLLYILDYQACTAVNALCDTVICVHPHTHTHTHTHTHMHVCTSGDDPPPPPFSLPPPSLVLA
jgi:hypothetical protein